MLGNNAAGAAQQQSDLKPDPDAKAPGGPPSRPPLAGGPAVNGKVKRAPVRRGKRSMYDTSSSSEEEEEEEQSDEEDDEVRKPPCHLQHTHLLNAVRRGYSGSNLMANSMGCSGIRRSNPKPVLNFG